MQINININANEERPSKVKDKRSFAASRSSEHTYLHLIEIYEYGRSSYVILGSTLYFTIYYIYILILGMAFSFSSRLLLLSLTSLTLIIK